MAEHNPTEDYANGSSLSSAGHNDNMYGQASARETGLYSVVNGNLEYNSGGSANIEAAVEPYQIVPGETAYPLGIIDKTAVDYFDETMSEEDGDLFVASTKGSRVFMPYPCAAGMLQYSLFISQFRVQLFDPSDESSGDPPESYLSWDIGDPDTECFMYVGVFVNGTEIPGARITLPITVHVSSEDMAAPLPVARDYSVYENGRCQQHSGGILLMSGITVNGVNMPTMSQGLNRIEFRLYIKRPASSLYHIPIYRREGFTGEVVRTFEYHQRMTVGHVSMSWVGLGGN